MDYRIERDDNGFSIYQPAEADFTKLQETRRVWEEKGNRYLASLKQTPVPEKKITGSFIYAHPPDYRYSMLNCTARQWYEHLVRLQQFGVDTVIFQAAAWKELNECYYPSKCFRTMTIFDALTPAMEAAAKLKLNFFMGEFGTVDNWQGLWDGTEDSIAHEQELHRVCLEELFQLYEGGFQGVYFTSESGYNGSRDLKFEKAVARFYGTLFSSVRHRYPGIPLMLSPYTVDCKEKNEGMADYWCSIFSEAAPDILAPQDSIGTHCTTLDAQNGLYSQWWKAAQRLGCHLWANVEIFDILFPAPGKTQLIPAPVERIMAQMRNASHFAEKLICWEMLSMTDEKFHPLGKNLREFFQR